MNKIKIIVFLYFLGLYGCECFNSSTEWNIVDFSMYLYETNNTNIENGIIKGDSLAISISFDPEFVLNKTTNYPINSLWATQCEHEGDDGLEDDIKEFVVTCNAKFNQFDKGESLNQLIIVQKNETMEAWLENSKDWKFQHSKNILLRLTKRPNSNQLYKFKISIIFDSGRTIKQESEEVQWN